MFSFCFQNVHIFELSVFNLLQIKVPLFGEIDDNGSSSELRLIHDSYSWIEEYVINSIVCEMQNETECLIIKILTICRNITSRVYPRDILI